MDRPERTDDRPTKAHRALRLAVVGSDSLLLDLLARAADRRPGLAVTAYAPNPESLPADLDAVVLRLAPDDLPAPCRALLDRHPDATLVGLSADGRRATLWLPDIGLERLFDTLRAATPGTLNEGR